MGVCVVVVRMILGINVVVVFVVSSSNGVLVVWYVWVLGYINGGGGGGGSGSGDIRCCICAVVECICTMVSWCSWSNNH